MPARRKFAIGQRVWKHETFGRREIIPWIVEGIEGRSYVLVRSEGYGREKVSCAKADKSCYYETDEQHADREWIRKHQWSITRKVEQATPAQLREIAKIVGYEA